jgi:hypothetical protein
VLPSNRAPKGRQNRLDSFAPTVLTLLKTEKPRAPPGATVFRRSAAVRWMRRVREACLTIFAY